MHTPMFSVTLYRNRYSLIVVVQDILYGGLRTVATSSSVRIENTYLSNASDDIPGLRLFH